MKPRVMALAFLVIAATLAAPASGSAKPAYGSPGYHWNKKIPKVAPVVPGHLVQLGDGAYPHVLVDAAGTGQITYTTEPSGAPSAVRDCVLARGQTTCTASNSLVPPEDDPEYNIDDDGPTPLAVGNQLLMIDHRYPNVETLPDGTSGYPTFLWTSEDGGRTFTGPGTIGNLGVSGNAVVFGGDNPQIGWITDTMTGGTFFQSTPPGAYTSTRLNLGDQGPDEAYDGRLALDGTTPVAEFQDLSNHIYIREYNGTGDITQSSSWSVAEINGQGYSRLVGGPSGVFLLYQKTDSGPLFVQRIVHGQPSGAASQVTPNSDFDHANYSIDEDASGGITVGWFTSSPTNLYVATSANGSSWSVPQVIAKNLNSPSDLSLGAAGDGGGFAAFQVPETGGISGSAIDVASFGTFVDNGLPGLGNLTGDGLGGLGGDPDAYTSCTDVHFGDIDAIAEAGCFLRDPANPTSGAAVISGEIRLNGLEIIPDAGVQIVINPKLHTINTTGSVRVVLRSPLIGDITLFHGSLDVSLSGSLADAGGTLFDFNTATASSFEGFPFDASIDVKIAHDSVVIPVSLKLPPYMGGVTGSATILASNATGLELSSLHIGVADLVLGALEIKNLNIDYTEMGDVWTGSATIDIPAGSPYFNIAVSVRFDNGDFTMGSFNVSVPYPGVPIFTDTYIDGFGGGFDIHPASRKFFGSISLGAIPLDPPNYTIGVTGTVSITFQENGPAIVEVDGQGTLHGFQILTAKALFETNGYFELDGNVDINLSAAELRANLSAFVDLPAKQFSANVQGQLLVGGYDIVSGQAVISSLGVAACGSSLGINAGFGYPWGGTPSISVGLGSCDISGYVVKPMASAAIRGAQRRAAEVAMTAGAPFEDVAVAGAGAAPSVVLTNAKGQSITPTTFGQSGAATAPAVALADANNDTTYVMIPKPTSGTWAVTAAAGSAAITSVSAARGYTRPEITASVTGSGITRSLHYRVTTRAGLSVSFAERAHGVYHVLGTARGSHGTLRFTPAVSQHAGSRTIYAIASDDGVSREDVAVAKYHAPGAVTPSRVPGLRVRLHGHTFTVSFGAASGSAYYVVSVTGSDGRHLTNLIRSRRHVLSLPVIGYDDHLRVTVSGVSVLGRHGASSSARV